MLYLALSMFCCCNRTIRQEEPVIDVKSENDGGISQVVSVYDAEKSEVYIEIPNQRIPISVNTLDVTIVNNTDKAIEYGEIYYIEKNVGDKWDRISLDKDTLGNIIAYDLVGHYLKPYTVTKKTYDLIKRAYNYEVGKYRIVIPYIKNEINLKMYSEFSLVKDGE